MMKHPFVIFLDTFIPKVATLHKRIYKLLWILETTGSKDTSDLKAELDTELKLLFHDQKLYQQLLEWEQDPETQEPLLLNNVCPTIKWLKTVLHELGHAVYELGYDAKLPWLLREPSHMITTEAIALICGRQAYRLAPLKAKHRKIRKPKGREDCHDWAAKVHIGVEHSTKKPLSCDAWLREFASC